MIQTAILAILNRLIVINLLISNDKISKKTTMFPLNNLISYVLTLMAAFGIMIANTSLLTGEGILLAFSAVSTIIK